MEWQVDNILNLGKLSNWNIKLFKRLFSIPIEISRIMNDIFFPLHDFNQLIGWSYEDYFENIIKNKKHFLLVKNVKLQTKKKFKINKDQVIKNVQGRIKLSIPNNNKTSTNQTEDKLSLSKKQTFQIETSKNEDINRELGDNFFHVSHSLKVKPSDSVKNDKISDFNKNDIPKKKKITFAKSDRDIKKTKTGIKDKIKKKNSLKSLQSSKNNFEVEEETMKTIPDNNQSFKIENLIINYTKKTMNMNIIRKREKKIKEEKKNIKKTKSKFKNLKKNLLKLDKPIWPLEKVFSISFFRPWTIPAYSLIPYFGERISLYFKFSVFYSTYLMPLALLGIIAYLLDLVVFFWDSESQTSDNLQIEWFEITGSLMIFTLAFSLIIWSVVFYYDWQNVERRFNLRFGQGKDMILKERLDFKNYNYKRSLINDFMNNKDNQKRNQFFKFVAAIVLTLLFYSTSLGISIGLFYLKAYFIDVVFKDIKDNGIIRYQHNIVNLVENIKIYIYDWVFYKIAIILVKWIDPKYMKEFERYLIYLLTIFGLLNNFFVLLFIFYLKTTLMPCAKNDLNSSYKDDCLVESETLFRLYVILKLILSMVKLAIIYYEGKKKQQKKEEIKKKLTIQRDITNRLLKESIKESLNDSETLQKSLKLAPTVDELDYSKVNFLIEKQIYLQISNLNDDYDPSLYHYYELFIQFTALVLFGILFPLAFLVFYITNILELKIDKNQYFHVNRRPSPLGFATIGLWSKMIFIISLFAVFTNAFVVCFLYTSWLKEDNESLKEGIFVIFIIFEELIRNLISNIKGKESDKYKTIRKRQEFIVNKILSNKKGGFNQDEDNAIVYTKINPLGEIDYEFSLKQKERETKKILGEMDDDYS